ncbi:MAG TPA: glycosyltransferase family 2 protein [Phycisphaerae bacterium]|nr:glycosyltransferase family 2 protein [Phycisphaerae bacterium]
MIILVGTIFIFYLGGVLYLCFRWAAAWRLLRQEAARPTLDAEGADWPTMEVVIPVKDEEAHLATCVRSVLSQDYPNLSVIVVNDRSTDRTPEVIAELQAEFPRLRRMDITELPGGLYGKPHALSRAGTELSAEIVVFVDSDFELAPHCLKTLVHDLRRRRLDWLAVMGKPQLQKFWERLLVPMLGAITYAWYDPRKIEDPKWDNAIGSGFLVVRREAYQAIGGHGAVVRAYDEDSEIMRIAKRAGHAISYVLAPELFTLRMYGTLRRTVHGISRTFVGGLKTLPRFLATINAINFVSLLPIGILFLLGIAAWKGWAIPWESAWLTLAVLHLIASTGLAYVIYGGAGDYRRFAFIHPLAAAMLIGICIRAARELSRREPIQWRGTSY